LQWKEREAMTIDDALPGDPIRKQLTRKGTLFLLLGVTASFTLAFRGAPGIALGIDLAIGTVVLPSGYLLARRIKAKIRQREMEDRLFMQTRRFLQSQEPANMAPKSAAGMLARTIDGRKLPVQGLLERKDFQPLVRIGKPVFFSALLRQDGARSSFARGFVELCPNLEPIGEPIAPPEG